MSYKIGVIGDKDSVMPFKMIGFDVYFASKGQEAKKLVDRLAEERYGVIFLTEQLAKEIPETIARYDKKVTPAVILIPNHTGSEGIGMKRVQDNVEKAVGQNIL